MKLKTIFVLGLVAGMMSCSTPADYCPVTASGNDLVFPALAQSWDEGIPLGNATVGALVWEKDTALRFSLDRTDLWDLRPADSLSGNNYRFAWVKEHIRKGDYRPVQKKFDEPYDRMPAPSKIPGAESLYKYVCIWIMLCVKLLGQMVLKCKHLFMLQNRWGGLFLKI